MQVDRVAVQYLEDIRTGIRSTTGCRPFPHPLHTVCPAGAARRQPLQSGRAGLGLEVDRPK